jgi:hypothetical protein
MEKIDGLTLRQIMNKGTTQGVASLTNAQYDAYNKAILNQKAGVPNFSKQPRKYSSGGAVKGMGAAIKGSGFKGVF